MFAAKKKKRHNSEVCKSFVFLKQAWTEADVPLSKYRNLIKTSLQVPRLPFSSWPKSLIPLLPSPCPSPWRTFSIGRRKRSGDTNSPETAHREREAFVLPPVPAFFPDTTNEMIPHSPVLPYPPLSPPSCCHTSSMNALPRGKSPLISTQKFLGNC